MFARVRSFRPSGAMLVALLALFVSLGGLGYAKQIAHMIDGSQIKKGTIGADRLSRRAQSTLMGRTGPRGRNGSQGSAGPRGAAGSPGSPGAPGAPGTAVAYAQLRMSDGGVTLTASKNISQSQVSVPSLNSGIVCFHDLNFTVKNMVASPVAVSGTPSLNEAFVSVGPNSTATGCPSGSFDKEAFLSAYNVAADGLGARPYPYTVDVWFQ